MVVFEIICGRCRGRGTLPKFGDYCSDEMEECWGCEGKGYIPTETGKALLEFLSRHIPQKAEAESK